MRLTGVFPPDEPVEVRRSSSDCPQLEETAPAAARLVGSMWVRESEPNGRKSTACLLL